MSDTKIIPYFGVGDIVRFEFTHVHEPAQRHVLGRVLDITERYIFHPLVSFKLIEGEPAIPRDHIQYADASFVVAVVERFTGPRSPRGKLIKTPTHVIDKTRSELVGWPLDMVLDVLHGKYLDIPRPISNMIVDRMFQRDQPGVIAELHHGIYRVRRKSFERWAIRNYRRFITPVAECRSEAYAEDEEYRRDYDVSFRRDIDPM